ncbi:MAG: ArsR/SmtB family transcription factor [Polymorphobacter sp.]
MTATGSFDREAEVLRVLGHPTRLALLALIAAAELPVSAIETASGIGQPALSQQLAVLRKAGLVATRRAAKQVYYRIDPAGFAATTNLLQALGGGAANPAPKPPRRAAAAAAMFAKLG